MEINIAIALGFCFLSGCLLFANWHGFNAGYDAGYKEGKAVKGCKH